MLTWEKNVEAAALKKQAADGVIADITPRS